MSYEEETQSCRPGCYVQFRWRVDVTAARWHAVNPRVCDIRPSSHGAVEQVCLRLDERARLHREEEAQSCEGLLGHHAVSLQAT